VTFSEEATATAEETAATAAAAAALPSLQHPQQQQQQQRQEQPSSSSTIQPVLPVFAPPVSSAAAAPTSIRPPTTDPLASSSDDDDGADDRDAAAAPPTGCARFKAAVKRLKREVLALYYACADPRTPWACKLLPWVALAYALSPLDLIPDFIPILGLVDDLLLLPGLLWLSVRLIPEDVMVDARARAHAEPLLLHRSWAAAVVVFALWTAGAVAVAHYCFARWAVPEDRPYEWAVLAGTAGACAVAFATWTVSRLSYERRARDEWNAALNAGLLAAGDGRGDDAA
jgi:uncharacterized membrane protein YkvA (DUF1232 family)